MAGDLADNVVPRIGRSPGELAREIWAVVGTMLHVCAAMYAALIYVDACSYLLMARGPVLMLAALPALLIGGLVATLVHEAGHQFAGQSQGWRPIVFAARPFAFQFPASSFGWVGNGGKGDARGWVIMIPPTPDEATRRSEAILLAGGPVASLALAGIASCIVWTVPWASLDDRSIGMVLLIGALGWQGATDAAFTLLPAKGRDRSTDGEKLRALWLGRQATYRFPALGYVAALRLSDVRLRETPRWMIDAARHDDSLNPELEKAELGQLLDGVEIGAALDTAMIDAPHARQLIDRYRATYGNGEWLASCDAFLAAVCEADPVRARAIAWSGEVSDDQRPLVLAVEAAIAARNGDGELARRLLGEMDLARRGRTKFRDVMFDDIRAKVERLIPASPV